MSDMTTHRKAIVRAIIHGARARIQLMKSLAHQVSEDFLKDHLLAFPDDATQDREEEEHGPCDTCEATGLFFPHKKDKCGEGCLSAMCITWSNYGPLWMALWLDCPVLLHDKENTESKKKFLKGIEDHGNTLFPRWLAEVLNEECHLDISEDDIYDLL